VELVRLSKILKFSITTLFAILFCVSILQFIESPTMILLISSIAFLSVLILSIGFILLNIRFFTDDFETRDISKDALFYFSEENKSETEPPNKKNKEGKLEEIYNFVDSL
jgi:hypothetical protein